MTIDPVTRRLHWATRVVRDVFAVVLIVLTGAGCATVPKESVELSILVGQRLTAVENSHRGFVSEYFRVSRQRVEDYIQYRWTPDFLEHFVEDSGILRDLENPAVLSEAQRARLRTELEGIADRTDPETVTRAVERALGDRVRGEAMLNFARAAMERVEETRQELIRPLDALEARTLEEIRSSYTDLRVMQTTLTTHLQSIRHVTAEQDTMVARLGMLGRRDQAIRTAVQVNQEVLRAIDQTKKAEDVIEKLRQILNRSDKEEK
jgi:hypothetical protein